MKKVEERFCRQLAKDEIWESIQASLLKQASSKIKDDTLLILDIGDIQKKHAKKMQYLAEVRDGDEKIIGNGYWLCNVIGTSLNSDEIIPLYKSLYSQDSPDFKSENDEVLQAVRMVKENSDNRGIWIIDRGGDRVVIYKRQLINALILATICNCHYRDTIV